MLLHAFQSILNDSERKPNKIWVNQGSQFYSRFFKTRLDGNGREMYSAPNKGKSSFHRNLINKICKHMAAASKKVYFDVLDVMLMITHMTERLKLILIWFFC